MSISIPSAATSSHSTNLLASSPKHGLVQKYSSPAKANDATHASWDFQKLRQSLSDALQPGAWNDRGEQVSMPKIDRFELMGIKRDIDTVLSHIGQVEQGRLEMGPAMANNMHALLKEVRATYREADRETALPFLNIAFAAFDPESAPALHQAIKQGLDDAINRFENMLPVRSGT